MSLKSRFIVDENFGFLLDERCNRHYESERLGEMTDKPLSNVLGVGKLVYLIVE